MNGRKRLSKILVVLFTIVLATLFTILPTLAAGAEASTDVSPSLTVGKTLAQAGESVTVEISVKNNPGVLNALLTVTFDDALMLTNVQSGAAFSTLDFTPPGKSGGTYSSPCNFLWDAIDDPATSDGIILILTFVLPEEAEPGTKYAVELSYLSGDIADGDLQPVEFEISNGEIEIIDYIPGDVNGDGRINGTDITLLRRYITGGYGVTIKTQAADVNNDGRINGTDVTLIRRYITGGYGVVLKPSYACFNHNLQAVEAKAATCTEDGNIAYWSCANCKKFYSDANGQNQVTLADVTIESNGSHIVVLDEAVEATCENAGLAEGSHCSTCGEVFVEQTVIPKLGHNYIPAVTPPTATENGYTVYTCSNNCGDTYTETIVPTNFTVTSNNRSMVGYTGKMGEKLVIPAVFERNGTWYRVTSIDERAFQTCRSLTSITIPSSVQSIGYLAFVSCNHLVEVYNLSSVTINLGESGDNYLGYYALAIHTSADVTSKVWIDEKGFIFYEDGDTCYLVGYTGSEMELTLPASCNGKNYVINKSAFYDCDELISVTIPDGVTSIGNNAFDDCNNLMSIKIGQNVQNISETAFRQCYKLVEIYNLSSLEIGLGEDLSMGVNAMIIHTSTDATSKLWTNENGYIFYEDGDTRYLMGYIGNETVLTLPANCNGKNYAIHDRAFRGLYKVTDIVIPSNSATSIGENAFFGCTVLKSVTIGNGVTSIGNSAFEQCYALTDITIPESVTHIGWYAFNGANQLIQIENGISYVDGWVIGCNNSVTTVTFRDNIDGIAALAFMNCSNPTSITIPNSVKGIGQQAFYNCNNLTSVTFERNSQLKKISYSAFSGCSSLTSITIPNSVTTIGYNTFSGCSSLTSITIPDSVTSIDKHTFDNCSSLTSVIFGENSQLTSIGDSAFYNCANLTSIAIPEGVTSIGNSAFNGCSSLTGVFFGENSQLTSIGNWAFYPCVSLTSITIPEGVTSIGDYAFHYYFDNHLTSINFEGTKAQWKAITLGKSWNNGSPATGVTCSDGFLCFKHTQVIDKAVAPTCTTAGLTEGKHCSVCNEILVAQEIVPALGHNEVTDKAVAPTCTTAGLTEGKHCDVCGEVLVNQEIIPANDHTEVIDAAVAATCTTTGLTEGKHCSVCETVMLAQTVVPALGHQTYVNKFVDETVDIYTTTNDAAYPFTVLGNQIISTNKSNNSSSTYTIIANYNFTLELQYKVSSEQHFDELIIKHNSSTLVTASGVSVTTFTNLSIDMVAGDKVTITYSKDDSERDGSNCIYVNIVTNQTQIIQTEMTELIVVYQDNLASVASCQEDKYCVACSDLLCKKIDHIEVIDEAIAPTCTDTGLTAGKHCSLCNDVILAQEVIPAKGHTYVNDVCTDCQEVPENIRLLYTLNEDGESYSVSGLGSYSGTDVVILGTYKGLPVTSILRYAFYDKTSLTSISIPSSITTVGDYAFYNCTGLNAVYISDLSAWCGIQFSWHSDWDEGYWQDSYANPLRYAQNLYLNGELITDLVIPADVTVLGDYVFYGARFNTVTLPNGIERISDGAFRWCSMKSIYIPDSVLYIDYYAFQGCSSLEILAMNNVTEIFDWALWGCNSLKAIYSTEMPTISTHPDDGNNTYISKIVTGYTYVTIDGAIYGITNEIATLLYVPSGVVSFDISSTIECDDNVYRVTSIGDSTFSSCNNLTSITIPDSVTSIGSYAFYGCSSLTSITFEGTVAQWNAITKNSYWDKDTGSYTVYCTDGTIAKDGTITYHPSEGLEFTLNYDGESYSVTGIGTCTDTDIVIPSAYNNLPVTAIEARAFSLNESIVSVVIPDSVTSIGEYAFNGCTSLVSITIPDNVTSIEDYTFTNCTSLKSVTIPHSVTCIGFYAFYSCKSLESIHFDGTTAEWQEIKKWTDWQTGAGSYKGYYYIYCTDGIRGN